MKAFKEFIDDLLSPWFVPKEDYAYVQNERWKTEEHLRVTEKELWDVMDSQYSHYRPTLEAGVEKLEVWKDYIEPYDLYMPGFRYAFYVPEVRFYSLKDISSEHKRLREHMLYEITKAFYRQLKEKFFKLDA